MKIFLALLLLPCLFVPKVAFSISRDSTYIKEVRDGLALTICERFGEAREVFTQMIQRDTMDHAAYLFLAGVCHAEMMDREDFQHREVFDSLVTKAISLAEKAIETNKRDAWAHLTIGNAYAYIATIEAKDGSWWKAMRKGLAAKGEYLEALKNDTTLYDAFVGLGTYHYWKSAKTEFINWLPFVGDRKEDGIRELKLAADSSLFSNDLAVNSLVWVYLNHGLAHDAYRCAKQLHEKFPGSRLVKWGLAFSSYQSGRLDEASDWFGAILESIEGDSTQNYFNAIECRYERARIFEAQHELERSRAELKILINYPAGEYVRKRQQGIIESAKEKLRDFDKKD